MSLHGKRKEIYKYEAPWTVYAMNWSVRPDKRFRLALGSFVEEYNNKVSCAGAQRVAGGERSRWAVAPVPPTLLRTRLDHNKGVGPLVVLSLRLSHSLPLKVVLTARENRGTVL